MAEWLRTPVLSAVNRSSSQRCGFEPTLGHMQDKPTSACEWFVFFLMGISHLAQAYDSLGSK